MQVNGTGVNRPARGVNRPRKGVQPLKKRGSIDQARGVCTPASMDADDCRWWSIGSYGRQRGYHRRGSFDQAKGGAPPLGWLGGWGEARIRMPGQVAVPATRGASRPPLAVKWWAGPGIRLLMRGCTQGTRKLLLAAARYTITPGNHGSSSGSQRMIHLHC